MPADVPDTTPVSELSEAALVAILTAGSMPDDEVMVGIGDDAALLRIRRGHSVVSSDLLVEDQHFRRAWCSGEDIGHRAAAQNLSDLNAMGGTAHFLTLGLALPEDLPVGWVREFARGFRAEADLVGARLVGGDLTRGAQIVVAVTVMGEVAQAPVLRSGAREGDRVALCGRQGWAGGGLAVLARGFRSPRVLVDAYRRPEPPYAAGPLAAEAGASAMIDVSDGLLADAARIAESSGVRLDLAAAALEVAEPLEAVGAALGADPLSFVLSGGDDHPLLATFGPEATLPEGWHVIGAVRPLGDGPVVTLDGEPVEGAWGWSHFG